MNAVPACTKCKAALPVEFANAGQLAVCPGCESLLEVEVFPAFFRSIERGKMGEALTLETDASCFYHAGKKASVVCGGCGRFICSLCDCELEGSHLCPSCLEVSRKKGKVKNIENQRILYDSTALGMVLISCLVPIISIVTAPVGLYLAVKHWDTPRSLLHRGRGRLVAAIILSSLIILIWAAGICYLLFR